MVKPVFIVASVILSITVTVSSLQCYVCYDCVDVKDEYIQSCDDISEPSNSTTTTTSAPTTTSTTTTSGTPTTTSTTTTPETPTNATTTTSTTTSTTTTTTTTTTEAPTSNSSSTEETFINNRVEDNYECFQGKIHVNNSDVIIRGCAVGRTNETCESFGLSSCKFCGTDKCNSAGSIQASALVLFSVFFLSLALKE